mmetsp:Transcript_8826/g.27560  ORF Transcript_8826/g.27560 Transcript_8826/m.27560 type:complete len:102 (-) Transcript_8826:3595-3900(-)
MHPLVQQSKWKDARQLLAEQSQRAQQRHRKLHCKIRQSDLMTEFYLVGLPLAGVYAVCDGVADGGQKQLADCRTESDFASALVESLRTQRTDVQEAQWPWV